MDDNKKIMDELDKINIESSSMEGVDNSIVFVFERCKWSIWMLLMIYVCYVLRISVGVFWSYQLCKKL